MGLFEDSLDGLKIMAKKEGNAARLAERLGESPALLSRWFDGTRKPSWEKLSSILERLGARIVFPGIQEDCAHADPVTDPMAKRVDTVSKTLREQGVAELEILRSLRSMLDSEIAKAQASYGAREPGPSLARVAEEVAPYNTEK